MQEILEKSKEDYISQEGIYLDVAVQRGHQVTERTKPPRTVREGIKCHLTSSHIVKIL